MKAVSVLIFPLLVLQSSGHTLERRSLLSRVGRDGDHHVHAHGVHNHLHQQQTLNNSPFTSTGYLPPVEEDNEDSLSGYVSVDKDTARKVPTLETQFTPPKKNQDVVASEVQKPQRKNAGKTSQKSKNSIADSTSQSDVAQYGAPQSNLSGGNYYDATIDVGTGYGAPLSSRSSQIGSDDDTIDIASGYGAPLSSRSSQRGSDDETANIASGYGAPQPSRTSLRGSHDDTTDITSRYGAPQPSKTSLRGSDDDTTDIASEYGAPQSSRTSQRGSDDDTTNIDSGYGAPQSSRSPQRGAGDESANIASEYGAPQSSRTSQRGSENTTIDIASGYGAPKSSRTSQIGSENTTTDITSGYGAPQSSGSSQQSSDDDTTDIASGYGAPQYSRSSQRGSNDDTTDIASGYGAPQPSRSTLRDSDEDTTDIASGYGAPQSSSSSQRGADNDTVDIVSGNKVPKSFGLNQRGSNSDTAEVTSEYGAPKTGVVRDYATTTAEAASGYGAPQSNEFPEGDYNDYTSDIDTEYVDYGAPLRGSDVTRSDNAFGASKKASGIKTGINDAATGIASDEEGQKKGSASSRNTSKYGPPIASVNQRGVEDTTSDIANEYDALVLDYATSQKSLASEYGAPAQAENTSRRGSTILNTENVAAYGVPLEASATNHGNDGATLATLYGAPLEADESQDRRKSGNSRFNASFDESALRGYDSSNEGHLASYYAEDASSEGSESVNVDNIASYRNSDSFADNQDNIPVIVEPFTNSVVPAPGYDASLVGGKQTRYNNQQAESLSGYEVTTINDSEYTTSSDLSGYTSGEYCIDCTTDNTAESSTLKQYAVDSTEEADNNITTENALGQYTKFSNSHEREEKSVSQYNGSQFPFQLVASKGEKQCPGGSLQHCVAICPGTTARVYGACVLSCGNRCA
ncbi:dentin sialophosphoprotein isoform X3 [Eurytemora carolleeae]|uniref:dentin sialophosphoprotein isoform X3 n=1 Tax=Eurytemora carolleeae TaxID=1294199 RepID=UPI000C774CDA|nr:dentin sialophosphoprotein isoform X3 [Eurytemora carolleeae]|eukprot:XP_023338469.1 dentin sialophosphoprotein-like isoform X3 [Eurytemora affinis]